MTTKRSPTPAELVVILDELIAGARARQEVADWAHKLYSADELVHSEIVAETLESLGAVDLVGGDRPYLYTEDDFIQWRSKVARQGQQ